MGTPPIPLARSQPDNPALKAYLDEMHRITEYMASHASIDWPMIHEWESHAERLRIASMRVPDPFARDRHFGSAAQDDPIALDWAMRAKIISPNEARIRYGYSAREAADALMVMTTSGPISWPGEASNEIDGMALCGYDEL